MPIQAEFGSTFVITDDNISYFLSQLTSKEITSAKRSALRSAGNKLTRAAVKAFMAKHPHNPNKGKGAKKGNGGLMYSDIEEAWEQANSVFAGGAVEWGFDKFNKPLMSKWGVRKVQRFGEYVDWFPVFLLDWFEYGTKERATKGRRVIGRASRRVGGRWYKVRAGRGHETGRIEAEPFVAAAISGIEAKVFQDMAKTLFKAIERVYIKSLNTKTQTKK